MRRLLLVLPALLLATSAEARTIYYGNKVGMELTIVKRSGIGSEHACVVAKIDMKKAGVYCREYGHDFSKECIDAEMKSPLHFEITANCKTGKFTTFYGANMLFQGRNKGTQVTTDYLITSIDDNVVLDGSGARPTMSRWTSSKRSAPIASASGVCDTVPIGTNGGANA